MPLSQRSQHSDRKGMGLVRLGAVLCLAAVVFGSVCMAIVATIGEGEDPPAIFEQMVLVACAIFAAGMVISLVGVVVYLNQPEPPKPTAGASPSLAELDDDDNDDLANQGIDEGQGQGQGQDQGENANASAGDAVPPGMKENSDPYAADHRRRDV